MKVIFIAILLLSHADGFAQKVTDTNCTKYDSTIKLYISGSNGDFIGRATIENGFSLQCADSSYTVIGFHLSYGDWAEQKIYTISSLGNIMPANHKIIFLKRIGNADFAEIDHIRVAKNGECFKAKSFICYIKEIHNKKKKR